MCFCLKPYEFVTPISESEKISGDKHTVNKLASTHPREPQKKRPGHFKNGAGSPEGAKGESKKGKREPRRRQGEPKTGSKGAQEAPRNAQKSLKGAQEAPRGGKKDSKEAQKAPRSAHMEFIKIEATAWGA